FGELDEKRRKLIAESESLKAKRNDVSKQIPKLKKEGKDADAVIQEMREVGDKIASLDDELKAIESQLEQLMLSIPNIPHESVHVGEDEDDNEQVDKWGEQLECKFRTRDPRDIATEME